MRFFRAVCRGWKSDSTPCIAIVNIADYKEDCEVAYYRMVEDLGCLMLDNPLFDHWNFDCFQAVLNLLETRGVKMPTGEILQECLYDSKDEIREFAKKRLTKIEDYIK